LFIFRIPFFFEPNFDAHVKPLAAARRIQDEGTTGSKKTTGIDRRPQAVVYGDYLLMKVGNNFATKYDN
jgi:isopenicillin N synthase-like dioxygenase